MAGDEDTDCGCPGTGCTIEAIRVVAALMSAISASTVALKKSTQKGMTGLPC
jgi:predicted TPR repeat methyltransferase